MKIRQIPIPTNIVRPLGSIVASQADPSIRAKVVRYLDKEPWRAGIEFEADLIEEEVATGAPTVQWESSWWAEFPWTKRRV